MKLADLVDLADKANLTAVERLTVARYLAGHSLTDQARAEGVTRRAVQYRLTRAAAKLAAATEETTP